MVLVGPDKCFKEYYIFSYSNHLINMAVDEDARETVEEFTEYTIYACEIEACPIFERDGMYIIMLDEESYPVLDVLDLPWLSNYEIDFINDYTSYYAIAGDRIKKITFSPTPVFECRTVRYSKIEHNIVTIVFSKSEKSMNIGNTIKIPDLKFAKKNPLYLAPLVLLGRKKNFIVQLNNM